MILDVQSGSQIRILMFHPIPDPKVKKALDPGCRGHKSTGSRIRIRNTARWQIQLYSVAESGSGTAPDGADHVGVALVDDAAHGGEWLQVLHERKNPHNACMVHFSSTI
jgi:hypothetical protein